MALTREFKDTVMELCKDPEYRKALLLEALESYLEGDFSVGNAMLRDYLNGSKSFGEVALLLQVQESGLRRMVGPAGNPTSKNLFRIFKICRQRENMDVHDFMASTA